VAHVGKMMFTCMVMMALTLWD